MAAGQGTSRVGRRVWGAALATSVLIVVLSALAHAQSTRTVRDGVFTDAQAARGQAIYGQQCASCHGDALEGAQAPPLTTDVFVGTWRPQPLSALVDKIRNTMPADGPGNLTAQQSSDLVAHILKAGGFPAGGTELGTDQTALNQISWPQGPATPVVGVAAQGRAYPPLGNMAQLMRGIFFPNSNMIFTVQTHDPGAPAPAPVAGDPNSGFSWVDWGAGIYGGWELVDNAAIALADASPLMLTPGIRCENGRLAPVTDADWIKFTEQMIAIARQTYKATQTRNQETVSEATGDLADACFNCHRAYRDIRVPGVALDPADPSNKAARCMSR